MKKIIFILFLLVLNSCVTNYYLVTTNQDIPIYSSKDSTKLITIIPKGNDAYVNRSDKKFRKIKWKNYNGWAISPSYINPIYSGSSSSNSYSSKNNISPTTTSTGGTVHVKGYTRKNGTYVQPHTRSAPRRR